MRKFLIPLLLVASVAAPSLALAATAPANTVNGAIKALDAKDCTVTLDNSTVYHFDAKCDFSTLTVGEKVAITWATKDNADWASKIAAAS
jgi:hypothetical protein